MHCRDAAHLLERYALLLELAGENPFKARAFSRAAEILAPLDMALDQALALDAIQQARGIGEGIRGILVELAETGTIGHLETLERTIPASVVQLTELRGIGAKRARQLWQDCGITSIEDLERACRDGRIARCKGFTAKSQASLLEAIAFWRSTRGRLQRHKCWRLFDELRSFLLDHGAQEVYPAGELRRGAEVVSSLAIVAIADSPGVLPLPPDFVPSGARSYRSLERDIVAEIFLATPHDAGTALFSATGSSAFIHAVTGGTSLPPLPTEQDVFAHFGLPYVPPELRDDATLPERLRHGESIPPLVTMDYMRGMLHVHTNWSDGKHSLEEMARAAAELGFEYIAICDHSQSAAYAGGLSIERVAEQRAAIEALNQRGLGIRILHGIESDILPDGSLDYPDDVLASFDLVVASVHSHFDLPEHEQTERICRALRNPYTTILGHPTGRLLLRRDGYRLDLERVLQEAARTGTAIEFNVNPYRLDLDWRYHQRACELGIRIAIDPDAHSTEGMLELADGITVARRGKLRAQDVLNTLPLAEFTAYVQAQRTRKQELAGL
ncbi:MAG: PHP domain-containing protein [Chlorobiota bacterium]|nr:MAG: PHP domain-containing protein [Chlorobiota bacterium]